MSFPLSRKHPNQELRTTLLHAIGESILKMGSTEQIAKIVSVAHWVIGEADVPDFASRIP